MFFAKPYLRFFMKMQLYKEHKLGVFLYSRLMKKIKYEYWVFDMMLNNNLYHSEALIEDLMKIKKISK